MNELIWPAVGTSAAALTSFPLTGFTLNWYAKLFANPSFWPALSNSLAVGVTEDLVKTYSAVDLVKAGAEALGGKGGGGRPAKQQSREASAKPNRCAPGLRQTHRSIPFEPAWPRIASGHLPT